MIDNKKGISNLALVIVGFALFAIVYFFTTVLIYETGKTYLIGPTADIGKDIINDNTISSVNATQNAAITTIQNKYNSYIFPYDMFFFVVWIITFSSTVWLAFQTNKESIFSFFGYLFIGTLLVLLLTVYVSSFTSWFQSEIFDKLFSDTSISMPIFTFYLANLGLINFIWWLILILVNIIDRSFISRTGEVQE